MDLDPSQPKPPGKHGPTPKQRVLRMTSTVRHRDDWNAAVRRDLEESEAPAPVDLIPRSKGPQGIVKSTGKDQNIEPSSEELFRRRARGAHSANGLHRPAQRSDQPYVVRQARHRASAPKLALPDGEHHQDFEDSIGAVVGNEQARRRRNAVQSLNSRPEPDARKGPEDTGKNGDEPGGVTRAWRRHSQAFSRASPRLD